jgi:transposase
MPKLYARAFKQRLVVKMTGKERLTPRALAEDSGVAQSTLERWLAEARRLPEVSTKKQTTKALSVEDKVRILAGAAPLKDEALLAFLAQHGVLLAELEQWRSALADGGRMAGSSQAERRHIRNLERELLRKDKALAEAAAILVLQKKVSVLLGDGDDDTDGESET